MSAPHIGQTMQQRRAMAHYLPMAEQAKHERAADEVNGLLDRVRQAGTGECSQHGDVSSWRDALRFWACAAAFLAGWFVVGVGGASLYFLIRGWLA